MNRKERIRACLEQISPAHLVVEDESYMHSTGKDAQSHMKVIAVSENFRGLSRVARHRMINELLQSEFASGLHALSLQLFSETEWQNRKGQVKQSPKCLGGSKHE